jgi:CheY-like chemotaxis protein
MSSSETASDRPTVLIVDDERFNLSALHALLRDDCRVMVATDGELGLTAARANLPDLILLDVTMPGISGHDVCRALKEDPATQSIPIIFITALVDADTRKVKSPPLLQSPLFTLTLTRACPFSKVGFPINSKYCSESLARDTAISGFRELQSPSITTVSS